MTTRVRIGAVSYLNTKPLIYRLKELLTDCELLLDLPSRLADRLAVGDLDVALIPSVEYFRGEGLQIVSDACIACRGPVRSVRLLFRKPPVEVQTLAIDEGSRTSVALGQILLHQRYGVRPRLVPLSIDAPLNEVATDALLVIGDRAMNTDEHGLYASWDLGDEWRRQTGLPFVFAMWVARGEIDGRVVEALQKARDLGLANLGEIVQCESPKYGLSPASCELYFRDQLYFYLGANERCGLQRFQDLAGQMGMIPVSAPSNRATDRLAVD